MLDLRSVTIVGYAESYSKRVTDATVELVWKLVQRSHHRAITIANVVARPPRIAGQSGPSDRVVGRAAVRLERIYHWPASAVECVPHRGRARVRLECVLCAVVISATKKAHKSHDQCATNHVVICAHYFRAITFTMYSGFDGINART